MSHRPDVSFVLALLLTGVACSSAATSSSAPPPAVDGAGPVDEAGPTRDDAQSHDDARRDAATERDAGLDAPRPDAPEVDGPTTNDDGPGGEGGDVADAGRSNLCVRLRDPLRPNAITQLAEQVDKDYVTRVYRDCSVAKMARTDLDTIFNFYNDLLLFSLDLWGCSDRAPMGFGIVRTAVVTELTSADAGRLIDHYVAAATSLLHLDLAEAAQLRQDLTRLGATAITRQSEEFALSACDAGIDASDASSDGAAADAAEEEGGDPPDAMDEMGESG